MFCLPSRLCPLSDCTPAQPPSQLSEQCMRNSVCRFLQLADSICSLLSSWLCMMTQAFPQHQQFPPCHPSHERHLHRKQCVVVQGIVFSVRPPKKSWKNIANLSGGEKTLSSLSLVFALHHYKPTPLYVMDEIDAALGMLPELVHASCTAFDCLGSPHMPDRARQACIKLTFKSAHAW